MKRLSLVLALLFMLAAGNAMAANMYVSVYDITEGGAQYTFDLGLFPDGNYAPGTTIDTGITASTLGLSDWSTVVGSVYGFDNASDGGFPVQTSTFNYLGSWDGDGVADLKLSETGEAGDVSKLQYLSVLPSLGLSLKTSPSGYYARMNAGGTAVGTLNGALYSDNDAELALAADGSASGFLLSGMLTQELDYLTGNEAYSLLKNANLAFNFFADGDGSLNFQIAEAAAVPVPAALWLLGSGLLGLLGLRKKFNA